MAFILTFLLVTGLEVAYADKEPQVVIVEDKPTEPDLCVGCDDKKEENKAEDKALEIEVVIDPKTGDVQYIIKGLEIKQVN